MFVFEILKICRFIVITKKSALAEYEATALKSRQNILRPTELVYIPVNFFEDDNFPFLLLILQFSDLPWCSIYSLTLFKRILRDFRRKCTRTC
jgi:hypothetical protein